jgi:hypothetical protein
MEEYMADELTDKEFFELLFALKETHDKHELLQRAYEKQTGIRWTIPLFTSKFEKKPGEPF